MASTRQILATKVDDGPRTRAQALAIIDQARLPDLPTSVLVREWVECIPNPSSARAYARVIVPWLEFCARSDIDPATARSRDARRYLVSLERYAPGTRAMHCAVARSFYEEAIDEGIAAGNPFRKVRPVSSRPIDPTPALRETEWERVLDGIEADAAMGGHRRVVVCARDFAVVYAAGRVGLRRIELVRLAWSTVRERDDGTVLRVHGKGDKWVDMQLPDDVSLCLLTWRTTCEASLGREVWPSEPIFPVVGMGAEPGLDERGHMVHLDPMSMTRLVARRATRAGLEGPRFAAHCLRATAATLAYEHGADVLRIQAMLRHASLTTTQIYIKRAEEARGSAAEEWQPRQRSHSRRRGLRVVA